MLPKLASIASPSLSSTIVAPILLLGLLVCSSASAGGWEVISRDQGIVVEQKYVDGLDLPIIRGTGKVDANIYEILAILDDADQFHKWMHGCRKSKLLETINDYDRIIYNRTATPWPVSDRDAIVYTQVTVDSEKRSVLATFDSIDKHDYGEVDGVVRMPMLKGFYLLEWLGEGSTRVTYQAQADPGGLIPDFIVASESRDIPFKTIQSLRLRVRNRQNISKAFLEKWDPRYGGKGFDADHPKRSHKVR